MGVDLRLLPVHHLHENTDGSLWGFSHTVLDVPRRREMWAVIEELDAQPIPATANLSSFCTGKVPDGKSAGETMYGWRPTDAYGAAYTWIKANALRPVFNEWLRDHPVTAYLNAMKNDEMVILDWH